MNTFQNHPELGSSLRSLHVRRVLHVTEEGPVVTELGRVQLDGHVLLVDVSDELDPVFELVLPRKSLPVGIMVNLKEKKKINQPVVKMVLLKLRTGATRTTNFLELGQKF